jgi:hypothetical protein
MLTSDQILVMGIHFVSDEMVEISHAAAAAAATAQNTKNVNKNVNKTKK